MFANGPPFLAGFAAMIGDAAFLVGDDDFHAVAEDGFFEHRLPRFAVGGIGADDVDGLAEHGFDDAVDVLLVGVSRRQYPRP